jgi:hypothetical protein
MPTLRHITLRRLLLTSVMSSSVFTLGGILCDSVSGYPTLHDRELPGWFGSISITRSEMNIQNGQIWRDNQSGTEITIGPPGPPAVALYRLPNDDPGSPFRGIYPPVLTKNYTFVRQGEPVARQKTPRAPLISRVAEFLFGA